MRPDYESQLPPSRRHPGRRDWGALVAKLFCLFFALVGLFPLVLGGVAHSRQARAWAARETERLLRSQHFTATYEVGVTFWPAAIQVKNLRF